MNGDGGVTLGLVGKRALVTGGSRGIGLAVARMLADGGAQVGISYRDRKREADAAVQAIEQKGVHAWAHGGDLSDPAQVERLFGRAIDEFGGLDIFVGNAGIWPPEHVPVALMTNEQWRGTVAANLDSIFYCTREAARIMADHGRIVLISSTAGQRGEAGHADYAATKGGIIAFVKGVAIELAAHDITVNCVAPGWVDTEMAVLPYAGEGRTQIERSIPLGRVASTDDIAGPIVFLCSALARHITGEIINVNGGSVLCG
jgi:3-oxoacyl-[acyl-carrier protein] reductase